MRTILLAVLAALMLTACGNNPRKTTALDPQSDGVEVLCFHGAQRCATCIAIENGAKEVVETQFADRIEKGKIRFRIIDLTQSEGEALADKYEVTWSSLFVNRWQDGKETVNNLTEFAFANARSNPAKFKAELKAEIEKLLAE